MWMYTVAIVLILLWLLGLVFTRQLQSYVHLFLVAAIVLILIQIVRRK